MPNLNSLRSGARLSSLSNILEKIKTTVGQSNHRAPLLFHVKQILDSVSFRTAIVVSRETDAKISFPDTEIPENNIQNILDIDPPGDASQGPYGKPEVFGYQLWGFGS